MKNYSIKNLEEIQCPHCGATLKLNDIQILRDDQPVFPETFSADISEDIHSVFVCRWCGLKIPYNYLKWPCIFVSFYGKSKSGKSHILAMMTKQFGIHATREGQYTFRGIVDQEGAGHINALLNRYQNQLHPRGKHQPIEVLDRTEADVAGARATTYNLVQKEDGTTDYYPMPFIFELKKNEFRENKQKVPESLTELISRPYSVRERNTHKKYDLRRGIYLAFQDIKGEFCSPQGIVEDCYKIVWPIHTYGQIRMMVYNPKDSLKFVAHHNTRATSGKWDEAEVAEEMHIGNETIWNIFRGEDSRADTLVLISMFDECIDDFCAFLSNPKSDTQKRQNGMMSAFDSQGTEKSDERRFRDIFKPEIIPSMEDVRYFSEKLRDFLNLRIGDTNFTSYVKPNVLFVPISAMGCRAEGGKFPKCQPIWTEVPMIWLLEVLERRAKRDAQWTK